MPEVRLAAYRLALVVAALDDLVVLPGFAHLPGPTRAAVRLALSLLRRT